MLFRSALCFFLGDRVAVLLLLLLDGNVQPREGRPLVLLHATGTEVGLFLMVILQMEGGRLPRGLLLHRDAGT